MTTNTNALLAASTAGGGLAVGGSVTPPSILQYPVMTLMDGSYILYLKDCITFFGAVVGAVSLLMALWPATAARLKKLRARSG